MAKKLSRSELRVMLDYMGVEMKAQPKKMDQMEIVLNELRNNNPERYLKGYSVIVLHQLPSEASEMDKQAMKLSQIAKDIIDEEFEDKVKSVYDDIRYISNQEVTQNRKELNSVFMDCNKSLNTRLNTINAEIDTALTKLNRKAIYIVDKDSQQEYGELECVLPKEFQTLIELAAQRKNILMVGPAGCGKTYLAEKVAEALQLDFSSQSCTAGMSESQLTGWLLPTADNGKFEYVRSEFVRIYESGGVFLFDEMDGSDPNVLIFINQALANSKFYLPQRKEKPLVKKHRDFIAIGSANTWGNGADGVYHARNALDGSTIDRFKIGTVPISYDKEVEKNISDETVLNWAYSVRSIINRNDLRKIMSTRNIIDATEMLKHQNWTISKIAKAYFADWSPEEVMLVKRENITTG